MNWESILITLGICVAFGGPFVVNKMFLKTAKAAIKPKPTVNYVPDHIDKYGNVVMRRENYHTKA